jgi:TIR domain
MSRPLHVFLCHSSGDKATVRKLYQRLRNDGFDPWLDEEKLLPGQDWRQEIPKAVRSADVVLVCLSHGSITKEGFVQKEIKFALDVADEKPEGTIFIIPVKLEECEVPNRLSDRHWVNLFERIGYERLIRALQARASALGLTAPPQPSIEAMSDDKQGDQVSDLTAVAGAPRRNQQSRGWRNWGDHPLVVFITVIAGLIAIVIFVTGRDTLVGIFSNQTPMPPSSQETPVSHTALPTTSATNESVAVPTANPSIQPTTTSGGSYAFYGTFHSNGQWNPRYFKVSSDNPTDMPQVGNIVIALGNVNIRSGYIDYTTEGGWQNKPVTDSIKPNEQFIVLEVKTVQEQDSTEFAGFKESVIWIKLKKTG